MLEILQQHASEIIAGIALLLSAFANMRVVRAERKATQAQEAVRKMDLLVEIEQKNAAVAELSLVCMKKIQLLQERPYIFSESDREIERLQNNLMALQKIKEREEKHWLIAEGDTGKDTPYYVEALTNVRRFRVRAESDLKKESVHYRELLEKI